MFLFQIFIQIYTYGIVVEKFIQIEHKFMIVFSSIISIIHHVCASYILTLVTGYPPAGVSGCWSSLWQHCKAVPWHCAGDTSFAKIYLPLSYQIFLYRDINIRSQIFLFCLPWNFLHLGWQKWWRNLRI